MPSKEHLEAVVPVASHLAVLWFGFALGIAYLGFNVQTVRTFLVESPMAAVLQQGQRFAYLALVACLVCFAFAVMLQRRVEAAESESSAETADSV